jgi:hypothetical protein
MLVKSLLPPRGARLTFTFGAVAMTAELVLSPPLLTGIPTGGSAPRASA